MNTPLTEELQTCGQCGGRLNDAYGDVVCSSCGAVNRILVFPALFAPSQAQTGGEVLFETDSSCFHHPSRRAEAICGCCGRFVCGVCDIPMRNTHYCPSCLEKRLEDPHSAEFARSRIHYDSIALALATVPFLFLFLVCLPLPLATAPAAIGLAIWHWKTPCSILPRSNWRKVAAILLAAAQLGLFLLLAALLFGPMLMMM